MHEKVPNASRSSGLSAAGPMSSSHEPTSSDGVPRKTLCEMENVNNISRGTCPPIKEEGGLNDRLRDDADVPREKPRTIRQIREAAQSQAQAQQQSRPAAPPPPPPPQKKKSSVLGGLFQVREPTQVALNQVTAQIVAQHGSTSATKVPNVSMEKMPEFVPKVNTKWDGIPEGVKQMQKKEKERERERARGSRRDGSGGNRPGRGSQDGKYGDRGSLNSRSSSSTTDSFASRARSSGSHTASARTRFYVPSVNSSGDLASQQRADRALPQIDTRQSPSSIDQSKADSAEDLPGIAPLRREADTALGRSTSPKQKPDVEGDLSKTIVNNRTVVGQLGVTQTQATPDMGARTTHSSSIVTPQESSPRTPPFGTGVLEPSAALKTTPANPVTTAFIAGEARNLSLGNSRIDSRCKPDLPSQHNETSGQTADISSSTTSREPRDLENRPVSSRARLGLRANVVAKEEITPWEVQDKEEVAVSSPKPAVATSPRTASSPRGKFHKPFPFFKKDKDKSSA